MASSALQTSAAGDGHDTAGRCLHIAVADASAALVTRRLSCEGVDMKESAVDIRSAAINAQR